MKFSKDFKEIKGDASFRKFYRNKKKNSIIVLAEKERNKNLLIYDAINKILIKNKILAPILYKENYRKNYIEIQDLGNETILKRLIKKKSLSLRYYKKIIKLLITIQSIRDRKIKNFKNIVYKIPKYNEKILIYETNLFCDWYAKKNLSKQDHNKFSKNFKKIVKKSISNLMLKNNIFVHRDFHISNLMLFNNRVGVIDSQDA